MTKPSSLLVSIRSSIFVKLFFVLFSAVFLVNLFVLGAARLLFKPHIPPPMEESFKRYMQFLADDIAKDSTLERARELSSQLHQGIRIEGNGWNWASDPSLPSIGEFSKLASPPNEGQFWGPPPPPHFSQVFEVRFDRGPAKIAFFGPPRPDFVISIPALVGLLTMLTVVLFSSYLLIRGMLRPLKILTEGVSIISSGNFEHQVTYDSKDEFGRLVSAFNEMTLKIKNMIEAKKRLLIDVSHELRTPLGRARVALEFIPEPSVRKEVLEEVDEMSRLVQGILEGAQADKDLNSLKLEPVAVGEIVSSIVEKHKKLGTPIFLTSDTLNDVILAEPDQMKMVIRNLIENAIKYSDATAEIEIRISRTKDNVRVCIADQGIGIPAPELDKIFEPFYRVDKSRTRSTGGFGLGLSLCRKIIEAHGGKLWAESELGRGSKFYFSLPVANVDRLTVSS